MRRILFIILSIFSIQQVSSYYDPYNPNNNGPNLLDQGDRQGRNQNPDSRENKDTISKAISRIPIVSMIIMAGGIGYLAYRGACAIIGYDPSKVKKPDMVNKTWTITTSPFFTVELYGYIFELTPQEYQEYEKTWFKWDFYADNLRRLLDCGRAWPEDGSKPQPAQAQPQSQSEPKLQNQPQLQSEQKQQKLNESKPVQDQKPKAPPQEEKYLIIHEHFRNDLPALQKNNQNLRCWIEKNINLNEVPDRYKTDISTLSNDVFAVHEFNLQELHDYIKEHNLDPKAWGRLYGNDIQKALHKDSIQLLEQSRNPFKSWLEEYKEDLIKTIDAGRALNELGYCSKAIKVNNFCSSLMHYGHIAKDGVTDGAISRIPTNPWAIGATIGVITAAVLVPGVAEAFLVYNILQCSYEFGQTLGLLICSDDPRAQKELDEKFEPLKQRFRDSYGWEDALYDTAHVTGELGGDIVVAKASKTVAKYVGKVVDVVSRLPKKSQGEVVATTPDGQKVKVPDESKNQNILQKKSDKNVGGGKKGSSDVNNAKIENKQFDWTNYDNKHKACDKLRWKEVIEGTRHGDAKYKHEVNIEALEREGWERGILAKNGRMKIMDWKKVIGAKRGVETQYSRIEMTGNTLHGHPISLQEYKEFLKELGISFKKQGFYEIE